MITFNETRPIVPSNAQIFTVEKNLENGYLNGETELRAQFRYIDGD